MELKYYEISFFKQKFYQFENVVDANYEKCIFILNDL